MNRLLPASALLGLLLTSLGSLAATKNEPEPHLYYSMTPGRYALIGQEPDGGATYSGNAEIRYQDGTLTLVKTINGTTTTATGKVERASIAEADVLRFYWPSHSSTCLLRGDLDNYSRLSCYWIDNGVEHKRPGLEAYFPTETWPENRQR
ncbi:hypothetical protein [Pseudomonas sp. T8]|uniref:hypothetical protein n=1 Tax=Pseudomonas sp. T8 TaxID=645292 RepID=UPI0021497B73|nr:hypothetical protein [Pseudomonas sp. T8]UUT21874.1 hypothetical protein NRG23_29960 [Pseudomonas sp. T8]